MLILPATLHDLDILCRNLRASDVMETREAAIASGRWSPEWSVRSDLAVVAQEGNVWSMWHDRGLVGVGGVRAMPGLPGTGAIWFLGTPLADELIVPATLAMRRFIRAQKPRWVRMGNVIPSNMEKRARWLKTLGVYFAGKKAHEIGNGLMPFWFGPRHGPEDRPAARKDTRSRLDQRNTR